MSKPFVPALQRTRNLFELYQYACGKSEVPAVYHFWASVAMLAAICEGNIWYEKHADEKLYPNLYIFLIGNAASGKGTAISFANKLCDKSVVTPKYRGSATCASLIDVLGKVEKDEYGQKRLASPHLWLIMDELKNNLGTNVPLVEAFVALMTELFTATGYTMNTSTRMYGKIDVVEPIVNWLIGTTESDLRGILSRKLVDSGFSSRVCFIFGERDYSIRYPKPIYPPDRDEVIEHLKTRLWALQQMKGRILMTPDAEAMQDQWYMTRPNPTDEALAAAWVRQHDMLLKFAQLCCIADGGPPVIRTGHLARAKAMVASAASYSGKLLSVVHETTETKPSNDVENYIKKRKKDVEHSPLLRYFRSKKGMDAGRVKKAIWDLQQEGMILAGRGPKGGIVYEWIGG